MDIKTSPVTPGFCPNLEGPVQPGRPGGPPLKPIPAGQDLSSLFSVGAEDNILPPPVIPQRTDLARTAALLDELLILFHQMSGEARKVNTEASLQQMQLAKEQSLQAADLKSDAATKMSIIGVISLGVGLLGIGATVAGPVVSGIAGVASAGSSAAVEAGKEAGKEAAKTVAKEAVKNISQEITDQVAKELTDKVTKETAQKISEEVTEKITKEVTEKVAKNVVEKVVQETAKAAGKTLSREAATKLGQEIGQEVAKEVSQEVAKEVAKEVALQVTKQVGEKAGQTLSEKTVEETSKAAQEAVLKEVSKNLVKETAKAMVKALGRHVATDIVTQVVVNPQTAKVLTDTAGGAVRSFGDADIKRTEAEGDRMNAQAQETAGQKQKSDQFVEDFRELMKKMNQLINDLLAAKNQSEAAAARA